MSIDYATYHIKTVFNDIEEKKNWGHFKKGKKGKKKREKYQN